MADDNATETENEAPSGGGNKLATVLGILNLFATAGLAVFIVLTLSNQGAAQPDPEAAGDGGVVEEGAEGAEGGEGAAPKKAKNEDGPGPLVKVERILIQLRNPEFARYLRLSIEVEAEDENAAETLTALTPQMRDAFITYFSDRSYEEVRGSAGLKRAKRELLARLAEIAPAGSFRDLYITDFVVQ